MKLNNFYVPIIVLIIIVISAYLYFNNQNQDFSKNIVLEKSKFEYIEPLNITRENALDYLLNAEDDIKEMVESNLSTYFVNDTILKAKRSFFGNDLNLLNTLISQIESPAKKRYLESLIKIQTETSSYDVEKLNYSEVIKLSLLIEFRKKQAYKLIDEISLIEEKEAIYRSKNLESYTAIELIKLAKKSFMEERYDESEDFLNQANAELDKSYSELVRVKDIINLSKSFFKKYYWQTAIVVLVLALLIPITVNKIRKKIIKRKIEALKVELKSLNQLLIKAQENCYKNRTISESTYRLMSDKYKAKIAEIKRNIPVFESQIVKKK